MKDIFFLVKSDNRIINFLKRENFKCTAGNYGCPWYFINIENKIYKPGRPGVEYGHVIGNQAIKLREFVKIYRIYRKYQV